VLRSLAKLWNIEDLRKRILYTLFLLVIFRLGVYVPTPGIDREALAAFFERSRGTLLDVFDMFSGGGLERFSVFALGIMPYISSSIIFSSWLLLFPHSKSFKRKASSGAGRSTSIRATLRLRLHSSKGLESASA